MEAKQTPLTDLLERVPQDARLVVEHGRFSSSSYPVGKLCHEAAAALKAALAEPQDEPVAKVEVMTTGGNAGLATRIVEIDDHLRERLRPGQMLYTTPPRRKPLTDDQIDEGYRRHEEKHLLVASVWSFEVGVRWAERAHGIGGQDGQK